MMRLILYSKPGCHLCAGLQEKLEQIQTLDLELEIRDITTRDDWFQMYQYEIPMLFWDQNSTSPPSSPSPHSSSAPLLLPRPSPRATVAQLEEMLRKHLSLAGDR